MRIELEQVTGLDDESLLSALETLAQTDRQTGATIVAHLAILDERGLYLDLGYSSLYVYATEHLRFSPNIAFKRIRAARVARRFPEVIGLLDSGELSLTTVVMLASELLRPGADPGLLLLARGKTKKEVSELVSKEWPRGQSLRLSVNETFLDKLEQAKDLYRHQVPDGNVEKILEKALDALLAQGKKKRFGNPVKRTVYERDGGRCTFVGTNGRRCNAKAFLEVDHRHPRALGGTHTVENTRLLCRAHNQREAERVFGKNHMDEARLRQQRRSQVVSALRNLGFRPEEIRAVDTDYPLSVPLEEMIREILRRLASEQPGREKRPPDG